MLQRLLKRWASAWMALYYAGLGVVVVYAINLAIKNPYIPWELSAVVAMGVCMAVGHWTHSSIKKLISSKRAYEDERRW